MLEFNAAEFYKATGYIRFIESTIGSVMEQDDSNLEFSTVGKTQRMWLETGIKDLEKSLETLGARVTIVLLQRFFNDPDSGGKLTWGQLRKRFEHLNGRLYDELTLVKLITIEDRNLAFYAPNRALFDETFQANFLSASFDLDEAGKCIALGRPTAAVFHLMRIMEIGVRAFAACLGIPDPIKPAERNWGYILKAIKGAIDVKWPSQRDRMCGDAILFDGLYASLDAVKNPWRNATMHVANKYTDDEAEHVFFAVKGFMKKLASQMNENGEPRI